MKKLVKNSILLAISVWAINGNAQDGIIRGRLIESTSAAILTGISIEIDGVDAGTTDLEGKFEVSTTAGKHSLTFIGETIANTTVSDIEVSTESPTLLGDIRLSAKAQSMGAVSISVKKMNNTEEALLTAKKMAPSMIDGISSANFKRIGDGDAAAAISRVTGVSVDGGKYVYVRGLGDRYTKTTLNGVDIPGLDPDRNTIQMDLFPTNVIDNIIVSKTFTADLPADFTGGVVDIATKDFPEKRKWSVNVGLDYNPSMHLNSNYLTYNGGNTDFLGFDDGTRAIPTQGYNYVPSYTDFLSNPNSQKGQDFQEITRKFNSNMGTQEKMNFLNVSVGTSYSNSKKISKKYKLGYNASLTYKNNTEFYQDAEYNLYAKQPNAELYELTPLERQRGNYGTHNVLLGALGGLALKSSEDKFKLNLLHIQNGESKAGNFIFRNTNLGAVFDAQQYNLEYNQRSLTNILLSGEHSRDKGKWRVIWKISPTRSSLADPDIRFTRFRIPENTIGTEVGKPERIWRNLLEFNVANRLDITRKHRALGIASQLNFGLAYTYKNRDYRIQNFQVTSGSTKFTGDPAEIFLSENLVSESNKNGVRYDAMFIRNGNIFNPNEFNANVHYAAAYVSNEFNFSKRLKSVVGLRAEQYTQFYTGINQSGSISLNNDKVLNDLDLFPTINFNYKMNNTSNLRFSYARTIARPSLKELSYAEILDPITGRTYIGGKAIELTDNGNTVLWDGNLKSTNIDNLDIRWESFQKRGDMISFGVFYKAMKNPIEIVQFLADPGSFQPRNVGNATILGAEFEVRQNLEILSAALDGIYFNSNITITDSKISITESEYLSRDLSKRDGQTIYRERAMAGQAPYIINGGLSYQTKKKTLEAGVFYNVQGPTLQFVGFANNTDVYSVPFHSLNFNANYRFGKAKNMDLGIKVSNILNDKKEQVFSSFMAQDQYFTRLAPGTTISVKFSYTL